MSQQDNFIGGFFTGALLGGVVGGVLGAVIASRLTNPDELPTDEPFSKLDSKLRKGKKKSLKAPTDQSIEVARKGLEDKIAQLNEAIDDVRQQLSSVNGNSDENGEEAIARDY
jgi:hypothetical protein